MRARVELSNTSAPRVANLCFRIAGWPIARNGDDLAYVCTMNDRSQPSLRENGYQNVKDKKI